MRFFVTAVCIVALFSSSLASAFEDPTKGKPFLPWLWKDQLRPTITGSFNSGGIGVLGGGVATTVIAHQYDDDVYEHDLRGDHLLMDQDTSGFLSTLGGGGLGVGIVVLQLFVDQKDGQKNALKHARALSMTTLSHLTIALIAHRTRPGDRDGYLPFASSFPSGHASSAFATAGSLAYSYGWIAGVPATALAIAISAARVNENAHWLSDVVAGAALGIFWAHASNNVDEQAPPETAWRFTPYPLDDGLELTLSKRF